MERFLRLEKRREAASGPPAALGSPGRFGPEPDEDRPLRVLEHEGMPFVRCCVCRTDSHVAARVCPNCQSDLGTPIQRAFNQALARDYAVRRAEEQQEAEAVRAARAQAEQEARQAQDRALDTLLRMESRRAGIPEPVESDPPLGLRLARRIGNPLLRLLVLVAAGVLPFVLIFGSPLGSAGFEIGLLLLLAVAASFAPRRLRRMIWEE
ncbi:MAG TPA: hypothetical protein VFO85_03880 [Vicinamibacteria bacterium]|nr:hypothetical protein [Vicinamibacteria bacterium]